MDFENMMKMAAELRKKVEDAQKQAAEVRVTGDAGAGLVQVTMNGRHEVVDVKIEAKAMESKELLADLFRAACNAASGKVAAAMQQSLAQMAQEFGVDPTAFQPPK